MKTVFAAFIFAGAFHIAHAQYYYGKFEGELILKPLSGNNGMRLEKDYWFVDPAGGRWHAPAGTVSDGASIPRLLWSIVGDPWGADYRNAAVIHDVACKEMERPWEAVHLNFYYAMLAAGVHPHKAKIMYAAVYHFGPKWGVRETPYRFFEAPVVDDEPIYNSFYSEPTKTMDAKHYQKIQESVKLLEERNLDESAQLAELTRDATVKAQSDE